MATTILLCRNGATDWSRDGRLAGRREIGLSEEGRTQAAALAKRLESVDVAEILTSPLPRAFETAQLIADSHKLEAARDRRLTDFHAGRWEGQKLSEIAASAEYKKFLASPLAESIPDGEKLTDARDRMVASIDQALADNALGANLVIVSHAGPLRILLAHYLGMDLATYHRLSLAHGSVSALRFEAERGVPRVLALNWTSSLSAPK
jgi:broad specificity phosphatase PhoE